MSKVIDIQVRIAPWFIVSPFKFLCGISVAALAKQASSDAYHIDYGLEHIYEDLGQPDIYVLDTAPIFRLLIVCSPTIAEQLSKPSSRYPYSLPKNWTLKDILPLIGKNSILTSEVSIGTILNRAKLTIVLGRNLENEKETTSTW
jgi:hypothetical protein